MSKSTESAPVRVLYRLRTVRIEGTFLGTTHAGAARIRDDAGAVHRCPLIGRYDLVPIPVIA